MTALSRVNNSAESMNPINVTRRCYAWSSDGPSLTEVLNQEPTDTGALSPFRMVTMGTIPNGIAINVPQSDEKIKKNRFPRSKSRFTSDFLSKMKSPLDIGVEM